MPMPCCTFLLQPPYLFVNQETRRFDANQLTKFLDEYKKMQQQGGNAQMAEQYATIYKVWKFMEKVLRQQLLQNKYNALLAQCMLSNPVSAKMAFEGQNEESDVLLATIPYSSIKDDEVKVDDADLNIAGLLLTTDCMVTDIPEKKDSCGCGGHGAPGGMDGMM